MKEKPLYILPFLLQVLLQWPGADASPQYRPEFHRLFVRAGPPGTVLVQNDQSFAISFGGAAGTVTDWNCPPSTFITSLCAVTADKSFSGGIISGGGGSVQGLGPLSLKCSDGSVVDPLGIADGDRCLNKPEGFPKIGVGHGEIIDRIRDITLPDGNNPPNFVGRLGGDINDVTPPSPLMKLTGVSCDGQRGEPSKVVVFRFGTLELEPGLCRACEAGECVSSTANAGAELDARCPTLDRPVVKRIVSLTLKLEFQPKGGTGIPQLPPGLDPKNVQCDATTTGRDPNGKVARCIGTGACTPPVDFNFVACGRLPINPSVFDIAVTSATLTIACVPGDVPPLESVLNILPPSDTLLPNPPNFDEDPVDTTFQPPADDPNVKIAPFVDQCPANLKRSKRSGPTRALAPSPALLLPAPVAAPHLVKRLPNSFFLTSGFFSSDAAQYWRNCLQDVQLFFFRDTSNGGQAAGVEMSMTFVLPESGLTIELHIHMGNALIQPGAPVPITAVNIRQAGDSKGVGLLDGKPTSVGANGFRGLPPTAAGAAQLVNGGSNTFHGEYFGSNLENRFNAIKSLGECISHGIRAFANMPYRPTPLLPAAVASFSFYYNGILASAKKNPAKPIQYRFSELAQRTAANNNGQLPAPPDNPLIQGLVDAVNQIVAQGPNAVIQALLLFICTVVPRNNFSGPNVNF
ncbi:hypothetical protein HK102_000640 [Quaeritorhiza haematococci]|nr:hypothetical protein HK102_000640 [Quaeritorhiza haematococci]